MIDSKTKCKNCHTFFEGNYCYNCGQKGDEKRFKLSNLTGTFVHGFYHVHSGLLFNIKELFIQPGEMLRGFISGKRVAYINPFTYLILVSLIGGYVYKTSGIDNHLNEIFIASGETIKFTGKYFSYRVLLTIPSYALMCRIFYKSYNYNFAEHLVINTFLMSQSMVIMVVWMLVSSFMKSYSAFFEIFYYSAFISLIIYQVFVFFHLFDTGNTAMRLLKASVVAITGLALSFILMNYLVKFIAIF